MSSAASSDNNGAIRQNRNSLRYYPTTTMEDAAAGEASPLMVSSSRQNYGMPPDTTEKSSMSSFLRLDNHWFPSSMESCSFSNETANENEDYDTSTMRRTSLSSQRRRPPPPQLRSASSTPIHFRRSFRRRLFLFLTEPESSIASAVFFVALILLITLMNFVMVFQTMDAGQYTPTDCRTCGGPVDYLFDSDDKIYTPGEDDIPDNCLCPPASLPWTDEFLKWTIYVLTAEWILRLLTFEDVQQSWWSFATSTGTLLDALAIFPYYAELSFETNGLLSLRLLRLFRVFQLVRLGQYNDSFMSLTSVLRQSLPYLKLLLGVLAFGAVFFGSMMYWLEKGEWQYFEDTDSYQFVRLNPQGQAEISPFNSIPAAFWWFLVTATTVGYGDTYPTTVGGKWVATMAMLTGVLVIAFPVSVFSDLWSKQLRETGLMGFLEDDENGDDNDADTGKIANTMTSARPPPMQGFEFQPSSETHLPDVELGGWHAQAQGQQQNSSGGNNNDLMVVHRDDWAEMIQHMHTIQESQRQMRAILRKYHHH